MNPEDRYLSFLESAYVEHRLRQIPAEGALDGGIDLCSNDYLGLAARAGEFVDEFRSRFGDASFSSSASRLLSASQRYHIMLEEKLASLYSNEALLFNSGYHANAGCISALAVPGTLFLCDKLVHASIIDGLRIGNANFKRFPHNDMTRLRRLIEKESPAYERIIIVTESIFSMDGDEAPLEQLVALKHEFPSTMLYVDEAHAFGVRGETGLGVIHEKGVVHDIDFIILTFGKAAASSGAAVITNAAMKSYLVNAARSFIFSTALPPACCAWTLLMIEKIENMTDERKHLADISTEFTSRISELSGQTSVSSSQIIPFLTGDADTALRLSAELRDAGFQVLPIRRPTVPPGGERLRFSLNASLSPESLQPVYKILGKR